MYPHPPVETKKQTESVRRNEKALSIRAAIFELKRKYELDHLSIQRMCRLGNRLKYQVYGWRWISDGWETKPIGLTRMIDESVLKAVIKGDTKALEEEVAIISLRINQKYG